jgi:hypothetical protein
MKKSLFCFSFLFLFIAVQIHAQDISVSQNPASEQFGQSILTDGGATTITHSTSNTVISGNSVSCNAAGLHADNSYFRAFTLADFSITEDFNISMVEIGVEQATGAGGTQPITVYLYTSSQPFPTGYPGSLTQIGTADINVPDQSLTLFQIPVSGTAPAGSQLVVEIFTPDGQTAGHSFFIGSNDLGETDPSYILAADCAITVPTATGTIGFPNMQIVMSVTGETGGSGGTVFFDDFEGFIAGQQVACQDPWPTGGNWTTWTNTPCGNEDALVSTNYAFSGSNSALIDVVAPRAVDLVKPHGALTTGTWYIDFMLYIPSGKFGYFNTMAEWETLSYQWAFQAFFNAGGTGTLDAGAASAATFTFPHDTWFPVSAVVNLDADVAELWINNTFVYTWQYTLGTFGTPVPKVLDANDFFGPDAVAANNEMYIDDYRFGDMPVPVELTSFTASVNNNGNVILNWSTATEINNNMFEIERRTEEGAYFTIGYVNGAGTTTEPQNYSYTDKSVETGKYFYRLKQIDFDGRFEYSDAVEVDVSGPLGFNLEQNYPNPFNPSTSIKYSIPESGNVKLSVYNLVGEEVAVLINGFTQSGFYEVSFDASNLPSGVYLYKLQSANSVQTKKMMLLK